MLLLLQKAPVFSYIPKQDGFTLNQREHFAAKQVQGFQDSLVVKVQDQTLGEGILLQGTGCLMFSSIALVQGGPLLCLKKGTTGFTLQKFNILNFVFK